MFKFEYVRKALIFLGGKGGGGVARIYWPRQNNSIPDALHWDGDHFVLFKPIKADCSQIGCRHFHKKISTNIQRMCWR